MKVTLTHDGKSVELDLTAEQMTALGLKEEKKRTGYERVEQGHFYFSIETSGNAISQLDAGGSYSDDCYSTANYYSDFELAKANARADRLMRNLRRFAAENGGISSVDELKMNDDYHYIIYYNYATRRLWVDSMSITRRPGDVCFKSEDAASDAIRVFHDELIWYFTEYEAMLR